MAINKVVYGDQTLIDLTSDTATAKDVVEGKTFHDASGQQRTGTGTSGGVVDVEVNGTSVVDPTTKIAEVISYEEVTESKYESIPVAERESNGIAYFIKDLNNENVQGYPPLIYSDEEREVGVWRDGKPLYQKTIVLNNLSVTNNQWARTNESATGIETIVDGFLIDNQSPSQTFQCDIGSDGGKIAVLTWFVGNSTRTMSYLIFRYTKTIDTAGSGIWNGQGGIAHHYSTNETVIGTWIDGKPLYERTKVVPFANFTHNNDTYFTPIASDNTETLRKVEAIAYSTGYGVCTLGSRAYSRDNTLSYYWELVEYYSNVALHFVGESASDVGVTEVVITYQYTKTTD